MVLLAPSYELQTYIQGKILSLPSGIISISNGNYEINHELNKIKYDLRIIDGLNGRKRANLSINNDNNDKDELVKRLIVKILQDNKGPKILDIYDENGNLMNELTCNLDYNSNAVTGELVNLVTDECVPLCTLSRSIIHKYNLLHCGIYPTHSPTRSPTHSLTQVLVVLFSIIMEMNYLFTKGPSINDYSPVC
jgi:hypothetical protein